ncbi:MAG: hypothetical protein CMM94_00180 [Rickettsiales bacterium]|nr:hypothetical protein [Rickettsiales bacterium]
MSDRHEHPQGDESRDLVPYDRKMIINTLRNRIASSILHNSPEEAQRDIAECLELGYPPDEPYDKASGARLLGYAIKQQSLDLIDNLLNKCDVNAFHIDQPMILVAANQLADFKNAPTQAVEGVPKEPAYAAASLAFTRLMSHARTNRSIGDLNGTTAAHVLAGKNQVTLLQALLSSNPELVNMTDKAGDTPLHIACREGALEAAQTLVNFGANLYARNGANESCAELGRARAGRSWSHADWQNLLNRHNTIRTPEGGAGLRTVTKDGQPVLDEDEIEALAEDADRPAIPGTGGIHIATVDGAKVERLAPPAKAAGKSA